MTVNQLVSLLSHKCKHAIYNAYDKNLISSDPYSNFSLMVKIEVSPLQINRNNKDRRKLETFFCARNI